MRGWLIYKQVDAEKNKSYIQWFIEEATKQGISLQFIAREKLSIGINKKGYRLEINGCTVEPPDFVIVRTIEPLLQRQFELMNIPTFNNSYTSSICNHKAKTYLEIHRLGIPVMPTVFIESLCDYELIPFSFPFILKSATGRGGNEVYWMDSKEKWQYIREKGDKKDWVAQSSQGVQAGKDVRVFVVGKDIIASVLRTNQRDFRANVKLGGTASLFSLTSDMKNMVQHIMNHFNFGMVGIDFLLHENGSLIFNEIEDIVGSRSLSATTDINILEKYLRHIKKSFC